MWSVLCAVIIITNVGHLYFKTSDPKWPYEQTIVLNEPSEIGKDFVGETASSNIEIKEVYVGDFANQNVSSEEIDTVIVQKDEKCETVEASIDLIINKPPTTIPDQNFYEKKMNTPKDTQISQIVESSNVALR